MKCPKCGEEAYAEKVDVGFGIGMGVQVEPYHCDCGWVQDECLYKSPDNCKRCKSAHLCRPAGICINGGE